MPASTRLGWARSAKGAVGGPVPETAFRADAGSRAHRPLRFRGVGCTPQATEWGRNSTAVATGSSRLSSSVVSADAICSPSRR